MVAVTHIFGASDTIVASEINTNFDDLEAALANLDTTNLADDAGIRATQIADRYSVHHDTFWLVPPLDTAAGQIDAEEPPPGAPTDAGIPVFQGGGQYVNGTPYTVMQYRMTLDGAQEAYICEVELRLARRTANTEFRLLKQSVVVGGASIPLSADRTYYRLRNANPIDSPIAAVSDGDILEFQLAAVAAGTDQLRGLSIRITYKTRINN
jgi:hypothetical protein